MKVFALFSYGFAMFASASIEKPTKGHYYDKELGCWSVSVDHDATYCIDGPICSGYGLEPSGFLCPVKGDVAKADCYDYLTSYTDGYKCVLPVDTTCQMIKAGVWGCVIPKDYPPVKHNDSLPYVKGGGHEKYKGNHSFGGNGNHGENGGYRGNDGHGVHGGYGGNGSYGGNGGYGGNGSHGRLGGKDGYGGKDSSYGNSSSGAGNETISLKMASTKATSAGGISVGVIGAIAAAAAAVAAIAGVAIYRQRADKTVQKDDKKTSVEVVTP